MSDANVGGEIRKIGYIDLMNIQDPSAWPEASDERRARLPVLHH